MAAPRRSLVAIAAVATMAVTSVASACGTASGVRDEARRRPVAVGIVDTGISTGTLGGTLDRRASASLVRGEGLADVDGHGTEMAWIVHAAAPDARIVAVKAVDRYGATTDARVAAALDRLRRRGASVALVSLAGAQPLPLTRRAIRAAGHDGVIVVAAAGNDGLDLDRARSYPGGYRLPNLVTVAATDRSGHLLGWSNRGGPTRLAVAGSVPTCGIDGGPATSTGTSAAAALAAGALARHRDDEPVRRRVAALRVKRIPTPHPRCTTQ